VPIRHLSCGLQPAAIQSASSLTELIGVSSVVSRAMAGPFLSHRRDLKPRILTLIGPEPVRLASENP
jgi:hypothetical protein